MLSSIASFFFGSSTTTTAASNPTEDIINTSTCIIEDDVISDVKTLEAMDDVIPVNENMFASSVSDEEAGWVFVNNKRASLDSKEMRTEEKEQSLLDGVLDDKRPKPRLLNSSRHNTTSDDNAPTTRSKNIPNSALHASSVLTALSELRPHQKSERRQKERHLKRKQMDRANKVVQENSSSNRPNKRRSMYSSTVFSRAVNNRKC